MRIIKKNIPPEEIEIEHTCSKCKSIIGLKQSECQYESTCRNESYYKFNCPACNYTNYIDSDIMRKRQKEILNG